MTSRIDFKIIDNIRDIPGNIYCKGKDGVYLWCNDSQLKTLGFTDIKQILGKTDFDLCEYETASKIRAVDLRVMSTGNAEVIDVMNNDAVEIVEEPVKINRKEYVFLSHKAPLKEPGTGKIVGILGVSVDITRQKDLEQGLKKLTRDLAVALDEKQRFIRNINHEIRTPMQAILNGTQALKDNFYGTTDEERLSFIQGLLDASIRLHILVTSVLDISKFKEGKFALELKDESLIDLLQEVLQEFHLSHDNIRVIIGEDVQKSFLCDKLRLHQVLRNLIANSIRYGGKGRPITISVSNFVEDGLKYLRFIVKDEGIGIPEAEKFSVFEPFVEGKLTRTMAGGSGLGLAISKEIIESHRGRIWVENLTDGEVGARISFTIMC